MKNIRMILIVVPLLLISSIGLVLTFPASPASAVTSPASPASPAAACGAGIDNSPKSQVLQGSAQTGDSCTDTGVTNIASLVISILSYVAGIAAIIVVLLAGLKYITAAGDSGKITSAKNTLVYAIIGLVIAALAQVIVRTVFTSANSNAASASSVGSCTTNTNLARNDPACK